MAKILFIDDRPGEIIQQWIASGLAESHILLPLEIFESLNQAEHLVKKYEPDVIVVGHGLSHREINGVDVINHLQKWGYTGIVISNSGGGSKPFIRENIKIHGHTDRDGGKLRLTVLNAMRERERE
jgi:DNA-binding response OmpR family regulator